MRQREVRLRKRNANCAWLLLSYDGVTGSRLPVLMPSVMSPYPLPPPPLHTHSSYLSFKSWGEVEGNKSESVYFFHPYVFAISVCLGVGMSVIILKKI